MRTAFHEFDEVILDVALDLAQLQHQLIGDTQHLGHARLVGARHGQGAVRLGAERRVRQRAGASTTPMASAFAIRFS